MKTAKDKNFEKKTAALFRALGQPARLRILYTLGQGEACVCHLEAALGLRQAYISQHMMALRDSGLVTSRRDGKFVFYRVASRDVLALIVAAAQLAGATLPENKPAVGEDACVCPACAPQEIENLVFIGGLRD